MMYVISIVLAFVILGAIVPLRSDKNAPRQDIAELESLPLPAPVDQMYATGCCSEEGLSVLHREEEPASRGRDDSKCGAQDKSHSAVKNRSPGSRSERRASRDHWQILKRRTGLASGADKGW